MTPAHRSYLLNIVNRLRALFCENPDFSCKLFEHLSAVLAICLLDLEPARPLLEVCYAPHHSGAQRPRDPVAMLRSFILMALCEESSYNKWAAKLAHSPELVILSGFPDKDKPPGGSTFYDFMHRLLDGSYEKRCQHNPRPSQRYRGAKGRFRRNLKQEKDLRTEEFATLNEGKVKQIVARELSILDGALPEDFTKRLNELLMVCAVIPSAERGILGELEKLTISGDGSSAPSQADGNGKPLCTCHEEGIKKCDCDRLYADPDATWGWDSYREIYYFGYRLHAMCTSWNGRDLPLHVMVNGAHRSDVLMGVEATARLFKQLRKHLPQARMRYGVFDAGYDANDFYRMWEKLGGSALIALNQAHKLGADENGISWTKDGIPVCRGNLPFRRHGLDRKRNKIIYYCPAKNIGRDHRNELSRCPKGAWCDESKMGPIIPVYLGKNPRFETEIARGSAAWKKKFKQRTGSERFFSKLESKDLKRGSHRRKHIWHFAVVCQGLAAHAQAWVKEEFGEEKFSDISKLLDRIEKLAKKS